MGKVIRVVEKRNWLYQEGKRNWARDWKACQDHQEFVTEFHEALEYWMDLAMKLALRLFVEGMLTRNDVADIFGISTHTAAKVLQELMRDE